MTALSVTGIFTSLSLFKVLFETTAFGSVIRLDAFLLRCEPTGAIVLNCADAEIDREVNIMRRTVFIESAKIQPKFNIAERCCKV